MAPRDKTVPGPDAMPVVSDPVRTIAAVTTFFSVLIFLHVLFMAALVGGYFVAATKRGAINIVMVWGARLQLLTGLLMMILGSSAGYDLDQIVLGVKLLIAITVVALAEIASGKQKRDEGKPVLVHFAGGLALVNFLIGTLAL